MLLCAVQSFAGIEEVSLYTMSQNWGMGYDASTHTLTCSSAWQGRGWSFNWKRIDSSIESYIIEFASATTTNGTVTVRYSYNYENYTKEFGFDSGATGITIDMHTDFGNDTYNLDYILIKAAAACTITLSRAYFTTTGNSDVYQAENADYLGATLENLTSADNSIVPITDDSHYVTFSVDVPCKAVYRLNIGYSTKNDGDKGAYISINSGSDISYTFTGTGASEVTEIAYSTILNKGTNTIKIYGNWKYYYIDYLRVYEPQLYLIGNVHEAGYTWAPNAGKLMTFDPEAETFTCTTRIGMEGNQATAGTFAFATTLASDDDGWSYMNGHRWSPSDDKLAVDPDGKTATTNIIKQGWNSYLVPMAGTYTITMKADLSSFTIQGPAVYMFGLHEGAGYSWGTNNYSMMNYDAENEVYRLRTRIADGAETTGKGAVAFATAYSASDDWTYLNANRYGPSSDAEPSTDGTTNDIARNGNTAFTNIPADKYEVVVDMFSPTKTARFYPLYTFGYEVVGTNKHGSITCSTTSTEVPLDSVVTVTAVPDAGYRFVKWTNASDVQLSTTAEYPLTIRANTWLKAWFEPDPSCKLTIPANTFAFAKHNNNVYSAADGSFLYEENGEMYFNYTSNSDGSELFYPVHLDAGTYYFYCTLTADGTERKLRLYAQDEDGTLLYSGKKWKLDDSDDFGSGAATFETKGFTVTAGDYLIALYAKQNTKFSQINVVGVCNGATTDTYALTLSAGANGSVISNQINNAKILSGTDVLLLAEPASGYRFEQWSDGSTVNPRTVTMTEACSLTASFNQTNGCLNTLTRECESSSVTPSTAPVAVPTVTHVSEGRIINENTGKMLYYAFEITEPVTASFTLLTATSDKRQQLYLYSAQANEGTELVYNTVTYHQLGEPVAVNSPNSGENKVYPVSSNAVSLAAGKYVVGLYSELTWSQYDRLVLSAGADNIDCSLADITINANDQVCLPHVVRNLTVYQGGVATNDHDVRILTSVSYVRHAVGGGADNQINHWYPFCLPFTPLSKEDGGCQVYDKDDEQWYNINPVYRRNEDTEDNPQGAGYFYLEYMKDEGDLSAVGNEFRTRWAYIERDMPEAYVPYIILFVNQWGDTGTDHYFEDNPVVKFVGGPQTIEGTAKTDRIVDEGVEKYYYYANNTLAPISLSSAYTFANNNFDYREDVTVAPFECYIQATDSYKARHRSVSLPRRPGAENTATSLTELTETDEPCFLYDLFGRAYGRVTDLRQLPQGIWIVKQGASTRKIVIQ